MLITVVALAGVCWCIYAFVWRPYILVSGLPNIPSLTRNFPFGTASDFIPKNRKKLRLKLLQRSKEYGKLYISYVGPHPMLNIADPTFIKEIIVTKAKSFRKTQALRLAFNTAFGNGILSQEGKEHRENRKCISPGFHFAKLQEMMVSVAICTERYLKDWERAADSKLDKDLAMESLHLTSDIIGSVALGYAPSENTSQVASAAVDGIANRLWIFLMWAKIPLGKYIATTLHPMNSRVLYQLRQLFSQRLDLHIERRRRTKDADQNGKDLLQLLLTSAMTQDDVKSNAALLFVAGHRTVSNLLTWVIYVLAQNQEWQDKAREEVVRVCGVDGIHDMNLLKELSVLLMVIREALRMFPPVVAIGREVVEDTYINGLLLRKGLDIRFNTYVMHHDPTLWKEDPSVFNPLRFENGITDAINHPLAFMPFGFGAQNCIGQHFAIMETQVIVAMTLQRFSFTLPEGYVLETMIEGPAVRPVGGMPIRFSKLHQS